MVDRTSAVVVVVGGDVSGGVVTESELPLSETGGLILPERATTTGPMLLE